jgi:hypothetical protein
MKRVLNVKAEAVVAEDEEATAEAMVAGAVVAAEAMVAEVGAAVAEGAAVTAVVAGAIVNSIQ